MLNNKESNGIDNKRTRSILPIPLALALLLLASPKLIADPPGIQLLRDQALAAEEARHAQERAEIQRQLRDTQEKARRQAEDIAALRKQLEASQQQKSDSFQQQQRLKALEAELQTSKREADLAKSAQRKAEQRLADDRNNIAEPETLPTAAAELAAPPANTSARERAFPKPQPAVGSAIKDCNICPELVVIPSDDFKMGSPNTEKDRNSNEGPQQTVKIGYTLAVGKYEVTFAEWDACVAEGGCTYKPADNGWGRSNLPVINVSWDDIKQQYLPWLNRKTGLSNRPANQQYRLLTEAEWEYAARAGTITPFSFGDIISIDQANYDGNYSYNGSAKGKYRQQTVPVASFTPNAWGLYNMHGNVWEWVEDCFKDNYDDAPNNGSAVQKTGCSRRMFRGGSWSYKPWNLRSALRYSASPDNRSKNSGFRLARTLP